MRFALLVFYAAGTLAVPVPDERIPKAVVSSLDCSVSPFQPGTTVEYQYAGETINQVEGTTKSNTGLQLTSKVSITQLDGCDFLMRVSDAELRSKSMNEKEFTKLAESDAFRLNLESHNLIFTVKGKKITAVRPSHKETTEALNIKRGILSAWQLDEESTSESDVNGECKVSISTDDNLIIKTKSLSDCSKRSRSEIGIQSASIKTEMDLKPLESKSVCTYTKGEEGDMTAVECKETHLFKPFSAGYKSPSGAMTIVTQQLEVLESKAGEISKYDTNSYQEEQDMAFEHASEEQEENKPLETLNPQVDDVMNKLITKSKMSAKETSAREFTTLVMLLRQMDEKMMRNVWNKYFDCVTSKVCEPEDMNMKELYRQYMLDAISYCGTPSCVSVVKDVTISGEIAGERANMFLMSIALVGKTTNGMIKDILDIAQHKPSRQVFLTLGTLISRHCAKSPEICESGPVREAEHFLIEMLGTCSGQENHERVEQVIMILKAIGNAKRPTNARQNLIRCAVETKHTNITMSAFDALRGMACDSATTGALNRVVADKSNDDEKRIYAFQTSMNCPTKDNLVELIKIYNSEDNNQLSSFMWTHLTNLNESTNPANKEAREILMEITKDTPLKVTNLPIYTHSRNFEKSLYIDYLKSGVSAKANLVFNPENIVPKTAMFDMTAKVMGVPVDLVETVVGIDGVESLLENIALPEAFAFDMFKMNLADKFKEMQEKKEVIDRIRRKTNSEIVKPKQLSGFMSMKVMGQEVRVMSYDDIHAMIEEIDNMNVIQLLSKIAKGGEKTFSKSMMFLEMTYTVPTGFGLPLKLKLTGSTVGSIEIAGKLDMRNMFWGRGALSVNGFVKPTAVVEISGKMGIESTFVSTGLLVSSNMIVSNMLKGSIEYKAGQILKINVDTPVEPVQLFKSSSTPFMYMNEQVDMIEGVSRMINTDKCLKSQLIGYGLCTTVRVPLAYREYEAPYFPLSGPAHVGLSLVRGDDKLTTFEFLMSMTKRPNELEGIIEFSTPGAAYERRLSGKMLYSDADNKKVLKLSAEPYGKTGSVEVTYDTISRSASIQAKNNFFTSKDIVATVALQNQTNLVSTQYSVVASLQHDWYKFEHMTKYVKKATGHIILSKTTYAPHKAVTGSLEYNRVEKKVTGNVEMVQFKQAVGVSGQWGTTNDGEGLIVTATHTPSNKTVTLFGGYTNEASKKELTTSLTTTTNTIKNTLGWYKNGDVSSIENTFSFNKKTAKFVGALENKSGEKSLKLTADVFGKTAMSSAVYTNKDTRKMVVLTVEALGKTGKLDGILDYKENETSLIFKADVLGKRAMSTVFYKSKDTKKIVELSVEALEKAAKFNVVLDNKDMEKSITFSANVLGKEAMSSVLYTTKEDQIIVGWTVEALGKTAKFDGVYDNKLSEKSLKLSANVMGKSAHSNFFITNKYDQKSIKMTVDVTGKAAEATIGYYRENDAITFKIDGSAAGKQAKVFWTIEKADGYKSNLGYVFDKYVGGIRAGYIQNTGEVSACSSAYYGSPEKTAIKSCIHLKNLSVENKTHWQTSSFIELPIQSKKVSLVTDITKEVGHVNMVTQTRYNEELLSRNELDVDYKEPLNSAVTFSAVAGKYDIKMKAYTKKENDSTDFRFEASSMGKSLQFLNKYQKTDGSVKVSSSVILNGKTLPLSTLIVVNAGKSASGTKISIIVGNYALSYHSNFMYGETYGTSSEISIDKDEKAVFKLTHEIIATLVGTKKEVGQKIGFFVWNKTYKYGWGLGYEKQEAGHELFAKIQYATNRVSKLSATFAQDTKKASIDIIFEYIPTKKVSHSIQYDKEEKQLDVSIEFLPKMFTRFSARLENKNGYQLITNTSFDWTNFNYAIIIINSYVKHENSFELSTKVNDEHTYIVLTVSKSTPKSITLKAGIHGKTALFAVTYKDRTVYLQLDVNGETIFHIEGSLDKITEMVTAKGNKIIASLKSGYNKLLEDIKIAITRIKSLASIDIKKHGETTTLTIDILGERFKKLVFNKAKNSLSIQYKTKAAIVVNYLPKTKAITFTVKGRTSSTTLIVRADWEQKIASILGLVNKVNVAGMKVYLDKNGLSFKLIATPEHIVTTVFSYTDNTLKMEVNRISNKTAINEVTLQYVLSAKLSEFIFKWNKDSLNKITEQVRGLARPVVAKVQSLLHKLLSGYTLSYGTLKTLSIELRAEILKLMNKMDKAFDDYDFVAARDKLGEFTLKALNKVSTITVNTLVKLANVLETLKDRLPGDAQKIKDMIKNIKPDMVLAKAKVLIENGKQLLKKYKVDVAKQLAQIKEIVTKVTKNFTDTTIPVLKKAVILLKDFKIRGKRMEDIVNTATTQGKIYIKNYIKKANATLIMLKAKIQEVSTKVTANVLKMKVPYANKTVAEVIEIIKVKLTELKEKVKSLDVKQLVEEMKVKIMDYKIKGKAIKEYVDLLNEKVTEMKKQITQFVGKYRQTIKDLPETTRKSLHKVVAVCRKYIKNIDAYVKVVAEYINKFNEFAKPMNNYITIVKTSVKKHFGPLYVDVHDIIVTELKKMKLPTINHLIEAKVKQITEFFLPLLKPLVPLYKNLKDQVRSINLDGMKIGSIVDNQIEKFDKAVLGLVTKAKSKLNEEMKMLHDMIATFKSTTADQMIDRSIDASMKMSKEIIDYLNSIYNERKERTTKYLKEMKEIYEKVQAQLKNITSKPLDVITEEIIDLASKKVISTVSELSGLIKQVSEMDIANPTSKAWTDADIIGHLGKYGVNEKIVKAIKYAKDANITQIVLDVINRIETMVFNASTKAYGKLLEDYRIVHSKLVKLVEYIKSISKKDYESWLGELKTFTSTNEQKLIQWLKDMYNMSEKRVTKAYETMKTLAKADVKMVTDYVAVVQKWYTIVATKGGLVYSEVKQPTIDVYTHYSKEIGTFIKEQYINIKAKITSESMKIYEQLKIKIGELEAQIPHLKEKFNAKVAEIKTKVEKLYVDFMTKYGNMTWEEIANKLETLSLEKYNKVKEGIDAGYKEMSKKAVVLKDELKKKITKIYQQAIAEYKKIVVIAKAKCVELETYVKAKYDEIKPKVIELLKKYRTMAKEETDKLVLKVKGMCAEAKAKVISKVTSIYENNKNKTLKNICIEIKDFIINNLAEQKKIIKAVLVENIAYAKTKVTGLYKEVEMKMRTHIIPEVKNELESILNQTLRNTVIMTKEIIHAYTPYAVLTKDAVKNIVATTKAQVPVIIAKVKGLLKVDLSNIKKIVNETIAKVEMKIKEYIDTIKKDKTYIKLVTLVENKLEELQKNPTFMKLKKEIEGIIAKVEEFVKEKVEDLKKNPTLIKAKEDVVTKIAEAKKLIKEKVAELKKFIKEKLVELKNNPTFIKIKDKVVEKVLQLDRQLEKFCRSEELANFITFLKQIKTSGKFTVEKLGQTLKPYLDTAVTKTEAEVESVRKMVNKAVVDFAENPEETFWTGYGVAKDSLTGVYNKAKSVTVKQVLNAGKQYYDDTITFSKDLVMTCTDEWTKEAAKNMYKEVDGMMTKLKDDFKKMKSQIKELPSLIKKYYTETLVKVKAFVHNHFTKVSELTKKQIENFKKYWETSVFRAFVDTPLWEDLATEIKNHELVALAKEIKDMTVTQLVELKGKLVKIFNEKKVILERKYSELKVNAEGKLKEIKDKIVELYKEAVENVHSLIKNAEKIFEETRIVDIVVYVEKQYAKVLSKLDVLKTKFNELKLKYTEKAKELYAKYELKVKEMYKKMSVKMTEYKGKLIESYEKLSKKVKELYNKYRPIFDKEYKILVDKMTAKYNELKELTIAKYKDISVKTQELYNQYKSKIIEEYGKLLVKWNESVVRAKLVAFTKMTISETVDAVQKLPGDIKDYVTGKYGKLIAKINKMYEDLSEKVNLEKEAIIKTLQPYLTAIKEAYKLAEYEVKETITFIYKYYQLLESLSNFRAFTLKETMKIMETSKVMMEKYKKMLSLLPDKLKKYIDEYKEALKKYTEQYKEVIIKKVTQCVDKYKKVVEDCAENALHFAKLAGDKSLRTIHTGFKKVDSIEINMQKLMTDIRERVLITRNDGEIIVGLAHPEITPSFIHQLNNVKQIPTKVMKELKVKGKELIVKTLAQMKEIKQELVTKIELLKVAIKKYAELIKEKAPVMAAKIQEDINKYVEIIKAKIPIVVGQVKEIISKSKMNVAKVQKVVEKMIEKLEAKLMELKETIANNPNYIKFVAFVEKKLGELKVIVSEEIAKGKVVALRSLEKMKVKGTELMEEIKEKLVVLKVSITKYVEVIKEETNVRIAKVKVIVTKYVQIVKEKSGVMIGDVKVVVKKYVKIIKDKAPIVVAKVKDVANNMVIKIKEDAAKVQKMIQSVITKLENNLKELKETITKDGRYIKVAAFVEKMLKELKKLIKEKYEVGSEIAQKAIGQMKIKGEELMKKIEAKLVILKDSIMERVKIVKEKAPVMAAKAMKSIKAMVAKLEMKLKELKETITKDDKYIKLVAFVETKITELKKYVNETIEVLKKNPTLLKIKAKGEETLKATEESIKKKYDLIKKEINTCFSKSKEFIKVNIVKLEMKLKELIEKVKNNEVFIAVYNKLIELKKLIKMKIEELKTNPTILEIKSKGEAVLKKVDESIKKKIDLIKKEIPIMIAKAKDIVNVNYYISVEFIIATVAELETHLKSLENTVLTSEQYVVLTEKLNQLKKFMNENVEKLKSNPTFLKIKTKLVEIINNMLKEIEDNTVELRQDLLVSYNTNKNVTLRIYSDAKLVASKYYTKGMEMYGTLKEDAVVFVGKVKNVSRETYIEIVEIYNEIAKSSLKDICTKVVGECKSTFGKIKPIAEKYINETVAIMKREGLNIEKVLESYYASLNNAYEKIKSGVPVKDVLKPILHQIFGNIDIKDFKIESNICKTDPELCKLVNESWKLHKTLLKKYAEKIGGKQN